MALQDIKPGDKAQASLINGNFHYLDDSIATLNNTVTGLQNDFNSQINNAIGDLTKYTINPIGETANSAQTTADEALKGVQANKVYITSFTAGCIVYSNNYCVQWGISNIVTGGNSVSVSFEKSFIDDGYNLTIGTLFRSGGGNVNDDNAWITSKRKGGATFYLSNGGHSSAPKAQIMWRAIGRIK